MSSTNVEELLQEAKGRMYDKRAGTRFNIWRTSIYTEWIDELYDEIIGSYGRRRPERENMFRVLVVNLAYLKGSPLILPLDHGYWAKVNPKPEKSGIRSLPEIVSMLETKGYIQVERGYSADGSSAPTVIQPTEYLMCLVPESFTSKIQKNGLTQCKGFKRPDDYLEIPQVHLRESVLEAYNTQMSDSPECQMFTMFKDNFITYGRFHGSAVHNLPKEFRKSLRIDGELTFEVDIKSCLPFLALAIELGESYERDIYRIPGMPRAVTKMAVIIGMNNNSKKSACRAFQGYLNLGGCGGTLPDGSNWSAKDFYDQLEADHPPLCKIMYKNSGLSLMHVESNMMALFLEEMNSLGIKTFPIHDAVVGKVSDKEIIIEAFVRNFTVQGIVPQYTIEVH